MGGKRRVYVTAVKSSARSGGCKPTSPELVVKSVGRLDILVRRSIYVFANDGQEYFRMRLESCIPTS